MGCQMGEPDTYVRGNAADGMGWDGIHAASAGALWQAATMGFGLTLSKDGGMGKHGHPFARDTF